MTSMKDGSYDIILLVVFIFTCMAGLFVNIFIAAVDFPDWLRGRKIKACEKIRCVLSLSRILFLCISLIRVSISLSGKDNELVINYTLKLIHISVNFTGLWYLTLMAVVFFLKVADYKHALFSRLKVVIFQRLMCFIAGVTLMSLCVAPVSKWELSIHSEQHNITNTTCKPHFDVSNVYAAAVTSSGAFIIYSASSVMLVASVCRHIKQMRSCDSGLSRSNLDSYYVAIKSLVVCFLIYGLHVGANILGSAYFCCLGLSGLFILLNLFPSLHSVYLICRTPKLRQQFSKMIQGATNYLMKRGGADSPRPVE